MMNVKMLTELTWFISGGIFFVSVMLILLMWEDIKEYILGPVKKKIETIKTIRYIQKATENMKVSK
jgi:hypothetical protein